jgi:hypothetical protein
VTIMSTRLRSVSRRQDGADGSNVEIDPNEVDAWD